MVKVWITRAMYGNYYEHESHNFDTLESFKSWLLEDEWRELYALSIKDKEKIRIKKSGKECEVSEKEADEADYWEIDISTNDHYGCYKKFITRIDIDGLCIANELKKDDKDVYIVTNTFIKEVMKPLVEKLSQPIQYAD